MPASLRAALFLTIAFFVAEPALAQVTSNYGSVYSRFGVGDRVEFQSSQSAMMGGAGVGLRSTIYHSLSNPALWSDQQLVRLNIGAHVQGLQAEDATGERSRLTASGLNALQVSVPLLENRLGASVSLRPYTRVNYSVLRTGEIIEPDVPVDTVFYRAFLEGDGGLQEAQLGVGWRVADWLSLGASGRAVFGVIENRQRTEFTPAGAFFETRIAERTRMWGFGATLGAVATTTGLLGDRDVLSLGASMTLPMNLQSRRVQTLGATLDQDTLRAVAHGTTEIPLNLNVGLGYMPDSRWQFAMDVKYEPWSSFSSDFVFSGYDPGSGTHELRDRLRLGGGFQVTPAGTDRDAPFLARSAYRLGAYYDQGYVAPRDHGISTVALTGRLSMPAMLQGVRFDIGFEAGSRGTTGDGLVRDLFLMGTATINFGERWFIRRQFG